MTLEEKIKIVCEQRANQASPVPNSIFWNQTYRCTEKAIKAWLLFEVREQYADQIEEFKNNLPNI